MTVSAYATSPYYDTSSAEYDKGYKRLFGYPGRYVQARELTVLQGLTLKELKSLSDTLFNNGSITEGCQLIVDDTSAFATLTSGKVYYNGFVLPVTSAQLTITKSGEEIIGLNVTETMITESADTTLKGQFVGSTAYGKPGAHRLQISVSAVCTSGATIRLYKLMDGIPQITTTPPDIVAITNTLARRTYDESENYTVKGLNVFATPRTDGDIDLTIEAGKAYVLGYELDKIYPTKYILSPCTATKSIDDEQKQSKTSATGTYTLTHYATDSDDFISLEKVSSITVVVQGTAAFTATTSYTVNGNIINWDPVGAEPTTAAYTADYIYRKTYYNLDHQPVATVTSIKTYVLVSGASFTRGGTPNGSDSFPVGTQPVVSVVSITGTATFTETADYLYTSTQIQWSPGGAEPSVGTTYTVSYIYDKDLELNVDYEVGQYQEKNYRIVRGTGADTIPVTATTSYVRDIVSIIQHTASYTTAVYSLSTSANTLTWTGGPTAGSTYIATCQIYDSTLDTCIHLLDSTDALAIPHNSYLRTDYNYYLGRKDIIYINKLGAIQSIEGIATIPDSSSYPIIPSDVLALAGLTLLPNSNEITVVNFYTQRISMPMLHELLERVNRLEYNLAVTQLDDPGRVGQSSVSVQAMLTDGFLDYTKVDLGHADFNCSIDTNLGVILPSYESMDSAALTADTASSTATLVGNYYYLPYTHQSYINQPLASKTVKVNAYSVFERFPVLIINPETQYFHEDKGVTTSYTTTSWTSDATLVSALNNVRPGTYQYETLVYNYYSQTVLPGLRRTLTHTNPLEFLPETVIRATGSNFYNTQDNMKIYVDNVFITGISTISGTLTGTDAGSFKTNASGSFIVDFTIPSSTFRTGTRRITAKNANNTGNAVFVADGEAFYLENIVITGPTPGQPAEPTPVYSYQPYSPPRVPCVPCPKPSYATQIQVIASCYIKPAGAINACIAAGIPLSNIKAYFVACPSGVDPVAQTFYVANTCFVTKVDLYFAAKATTYPVSVIIKDVVNGYPGGTVFGVASLPASSVSTSTSAGTATTFTFPNPICLNADTEYALIVYTDSPDYEVYIAGLGETDYTTNAPITRQPYLLGTFFSSSNASAWSVSQTDDLKFNLYIASFSTSAVITYSQADISTDYYCDYFIYSRSMDVEGAESRWYHSPDSGANWFSTGINNLKKSNTRSQTLDVKVEMFTYDSKVSPMIHVNTMTMMYDYALTAVYTSKTVTVTAGWTVLRAFCDFYLPDSSQAGVFKVDPTGTGWLTLTASTTTITGDDWYQYAYTYSPGTTFDQAKFEIILNNTDATVSVAATNLVTIVS